MFTQHKSQYSEIIHEIKLNYVPHLEELKAFFFVCVSQVSGMTSLNFLWLFIENVPVHIFHRLQSTLVVMSLCCPKTDFSKLQLCFSVQFVCKITMSLTVFEKLMKKTLQQKEKKKSTFKWWLAHTHSSPKLAIMASLSYLVHTIHFQYISFYIQSTFLNLQTVCLYKLAFVILLPNVSICENCLDSSCWDEINYDLSLKGLFFLYNLTTFHLRAEFPGKN